MPFLALPADTELGPRSRSGHAGPHKLSPVPGAAGVPLGDNSGFDGHSPGWTLLLEGTAIKDFPFRTHTICRESRTLWNPGFSCAATWQKRAQNTHEVAISFRTLAASCNTAVLPLSTASLPETSATHGQLRSENIKRKVAESSGP